MTQVGFPITTGSMKTTIAAADFIKRFNKDEEIEEIIVSGRVEIDGLIGPIRSLKGIIFEEKIVIKNSQLHSGLILIDCEFKKNLIFDNFRSDSFDAQLNSFNGSVVLNYCRGEDLIFRNNCHFDRGLIIENDSSFQKLGVYSIEIQGEGFRINRSKISFIDIWKVKSGINLAYSVVENSIRIFKLSALSVVLFKTEIQHNVNIHDSSIDRLTLNENTLGKEFKIESCGIYSLSTIGDVYKGPFTAEFIKGDYTLNKFYIRNCDVSETFEVIGNGRDIELIDIKFSPSLIGILRIVDWNIEKLEFQGISQNLNLVLSKCRILELIMIDFTNLSSVSFDRSGAPISPSSSEKDSSNFSASNCDFGSMIFNEFDFESFNHLKWDNVVLANIIASNVRWFNDKSLDVGLEDGSQSWKRKREIYRQLKYSQRKIGNNVDAIWMQARELKALRNEKKAMKGGYSISDRLIMITSMTNGYGLNWVLSFSLILGITVVYFAIVAPMTADNLLYEISFERTDIKATLRNYWTNKELLFKLFNPARRVSLTYGSNVSDWIYLWDAIHKLILGVLIFQVIKSFRKYF